MIRLRVDFTLIDFTLTDDAPGPWPGQGYLDARYDVR